jgi:hypothetical protein
MLTIPTDPGAIPREVDVMSGIFAALVVAVAASLLERLAVRLARAIWATMQPASAA